MLLYCAPMEGITGYIFRNALQEFFPGVDRYYTPFISAGPHRTFSSREMNDVLPAHNASISLVPQLLTRSAEDFIWYANALADMGYAEVNFNLGCPSGTVVSKGKGSGFLAYTDELQLFLDEIFAKTKIPISVKTRVGRKDEAEFDRLLEIYRRYPMAELIVHPRLTTDMYRNHPRMESFAKAMDNPPWKVGYNGDLFRVQDCVNFIASHPEVSSVMLGRGLVANPAMAQTVKTGKPLDKATLMAFYQRLRAEYLDVLPGDRTILFRMKELFIYMECMFKDCDKIAKKMRKSSRVADFDDAIDRLFNECELDLDGGYYQIGSKQHR